MSMFFSHWDEDTENEAEEIEKIRQELEADASMIHRNWRDFDEEAKEIYKNRKFN